MVLLDLQKAFDTDDHNVLCNKLKLMGAGSTNGLNLTNWSLIGNGMVISIDPDCKLLIYANDSTILFSLSDPDQIANKLGKILESCSD